MIYAFDTFLTTKCFVFLHFSAFPKSTKLFHIHPAPNAVCHACPLGWHSYIRWHSYTQQVGFFKRPGTASGGPVRKNILKNRDSFCMPLFFPFLSSFFHKFVHGLCDIIISFRFCVCSLLPIKLVFDWWFVSWTWHDSCDLCSIIW